MTVPRSRLSVSSPPSVRDSGVRAEWLLQIQFDFSHFCQSTQKTKRVTLKFPMQLKLRQRNRKKKTELDLGTQI